MANKHLLIMVDFNLYSTIITLQQ